jgi:trimethylamine--corrinoid protein Co-methyltransferase
MAKICVKLLDRNEEELIHEQSVRCLETIGVKILSAKVLEMLGDAGADIDMKTQIAKIPESMTKEALRTVPKEITLRGRDSKYDMKLPVNGPPYCGTTGLCIFIRDIETGKKRSSTKKDIADFIRVLDGLPGVDYVWTSITATDVSQAVHGLYELWTSFQNTTKHVQGVEILSAEDAKAQVKLGALIAGDEEKLRKNPCFSVIHCSIAPLMFEHDAVEAMVEFNKAGVPISTMTMSLSGGTAPVTLAGTLVNGNCENLASFIISQVANKGAPVIYCSSSAPIDMRTGSIDYSAVNTAPIAAGFAQLASRYGIPCEIGDWGTNGTEDLGVPGYFTSTLIPCITTMCGADLTSGIGGLYEVAGVSFEQAVIDSYFWENIRRLMTPFEISEEKCALDVMKQVGQGNTFLQNIHTLRNYRKEILYLDDEKGYRFEKCCSDDMAPEANRIARELLAEHRVPPLDKDVKREGDEIIRAMEKMYGF